MASGFHNRVFDEELDEEPYQRRKNDERDFHLEKSPPSRRQVSSLVEDEPTVQGRMDNLGFEPNGSPVFKKKISDSDGQRERTATGVSPVISSNNKSKTNEGFEKDEYEPTNGYAAGNNVQPSYGEVSDNPVTESTQDAPVYKRRWYILTVFSLIAFTQGCVWNAFGPISSTSQYVFKWSNGDIALINNWVFISYFLGGVFFSWMLDVKGLRWACVTSAFLMAGGSTLRCFSMEAPAITWLVNVGHLLNGLAGPVAMGAPPFLSAVWFPLHQRATATAVSTSSNFVGVAMAFVLGPNLVPQLTSPESVFINTTQIPSSVRNIASAGLTTEKGRLLTSPQMSVNPTESEESRIVQTKENIQIYMIIEAVWCGVLLLTVLIYFPAKPPTPPCASAGVQRESFLQGLKSLLRKKMFVMVTYLVLAVGVVFSWSGMIYISLSVHNIEEKEAGWIGFYGIIASAIASLIIARFADKFARIMKWCVLVQFAVGSLQFLIFALASSNVITPSVGLFYTTTILALLALNSSLPLLFEIGCEQAYPIGEGTTTVVLLLLSSIGGVLFLFIGMIPNIGTLWMSWTLFGITALAIPVLLMLKERFNRRQVDETYPNPKDLSVEVVVESDKHVQN
ncbi:disrupted in renal carcinoma protein 2 homolog [Pomacea canaliculata]|uniref:disrupted in renal carcinoma protein 2 homolog n=1 Tax=Pomacea canaliculata TaxID=400727 RepID=UPI000D732189|nr:disrupted in renal carcinoma protein 2 homolog [Pomacea canaliculata]XP_025084667.1 disrupted in renal carcinoma protein 2 homolog [Pomacea canaliculata]XP_025084668.1 disrupted in renal carcinoma protein 2 homolog [Pomacea canaliculata]XP_025084669.1 disrupted in renal carcinoma protein 2 homolog [Pomacea canaliculata]